MSTSLVQKLRLLIDVQNKNHTKNSAVTTTEADGVSSPSSLLNTIASSMRLKHNLTVYEELIKDIARDLEDQTMAPGSSLRDVLVIIFYSLVVIISLFGNTMVCYVVFRNRNMRTATNAFITNLAISDLLMTVLNVPFNVMRILLDNWPFGKLMCGLVPFVQVTSVYVSTFTMTCIALHRYQVIVNPLRPRLRFASGAAIIAAIWISAAALSLPHAIFNTVVGVFTFRTLYRCQTKYPQPEAEFRKWITLVTVLSQYFVPLTITGVTYGRIVRRVWSREVLGVVTEEQILVSARAKRKTVKMLLLVVVIFAICWLPLSLYHVVNDFDPTASPTRHQTTVFFVCHWVAVSSVCFNPFIYCSLNDNFRAATKAWLSCSRYNPAGQDGAVPSRSKVKGYYALCLCFFCGPRGALLALGNASFRSHDSFETHSVVYRRRDYCQNPKGCHSNRRSAINLSLSDCSNSVRTDMGQSIEWCPTTTSSVNVTCQETSDATFV